MRSSSSVRRLFVSGTALAALAIGLPGMASAQTAPADDQATPEAATPTGAATPKKGANEAETKAEDGEILVTGSRIKQDPNDSALPLQIITTQEIQRNGISSPEQLISFLTSNGSGADNLASNSDVVTAERRGNNGASFANLRGQGSAATLVLLNGRRVAAQGTTGSAVDVNQIPFMAIERVEVLKDGASAIYGSDAVAGVVNFILRRDFEGTEISSTVGSPTRHGGGLDTKVAAISGFGGDRYSVTVSADYERTKAILGSDRSSFAKNLDVDHQLDKTSTTSFPANVRLPNGTLRSPTYPNCGPYSLVSPLSPGVCRYDNAPYISIQPETKLENVAGNARFKVTDSLEAYLEAGYSRIETRTTQQHVLINGAVQPAGSQYITDLNNLINTQYATAPGVATLRSFVTAGNAYALLPPSSPYYPTAFANANGLTGQPLVLLFRSVPSGLRMQKDVSQDSRFVAGVRGTALGWDYDSGVLYSKDKITNYLTGGWALTDQYLNLVNTGVINPFGDTASQAALDAAKAANYYGVYNVNTTSITSVDAKASRDLFTLPAGALALALGAEFRREQLKIDPSDASRQFLVSGFGAPGVPVSAARNVESAYAELSIPIIKGLDADVAARYDHYERVGRTFNPKASIRFQPIEQLLLRAAIGTGFRAPSLLELYQPAARGITTNGQRDRIRCPVVTASIDCSTQFVTIGGGNPSLKPEKSRSTTFGVLIEPTKDYSIGADLFYVSVKDTIRVGLTTATILADPVRYADFIQRGTPDGNASGVGPITGLLVPSTNLGKTNVSGVDLALKGRVLNLPEDKVTLRLDGTYFTRYDTQNLDGSFTNAINNPAASGLSIGVVIRWRHTASATWDHGPFSATLQHNYQTGYADLNTSLQPATAPPRHVGSYQTLDAQFRYAGIRNTVLALGVKNLADRDPPYTNYGGGFVGGYDLSYTDVRGRFVYLNAAYRFN